MKIGTARAWGRLRDFFDLKGKHDLQLDEIIVPVAVVADLTEADPLSDVRQAQGGASRGSVAGDSTRIQLFNPVGSSVILELYAAITGGFETFNGNMGPVAAAIATDITGQWQDRRLPGIPVGRIQSNNGPAGPILVNPVKFRMNSTIGWIRFSPLEVVLPPGTGWQFETVTVNVTMDSGFWWRERDLLPGE